MDGHRQGRSAATASPAAADGAPRVDLRQASTEVSPLGAVPLKGVQGEAPGYVVLVEQPHETFKETVEWHVLPGVGITREVTITGVGAETISRSELTLQGVC